MNRGTKFEDRASSSRGKHEGESSANLCDRLCRTRDTSQRQLPTDQDYAASTREYQTDQSSPKTAPAVACPVFDKRNKQRQRQNQPHRLRGIDRSLHISRFTPYNGCGLPTLDGRGRRNCTLNGRPNLDITPWSPHTFPKRSAWCPMRFFVT